MPTALSGHVFVVGIMPTQSRGHGTPAIALADCAGQWHTLGRGQPKIALLAFRPDR